MLKYNCYLKTNTSTKKQQKEVKIWNLILQKNLDI